MESLKWMLISLTVIVVIFFLKSCSGETATADERLIGTHTYKNSETRQKAKWNVIRSSPFSSSKKTDWKEGSDKKPEAFLDYDEAFFVEFQEERENYKIIAENCVVFFTEDNNRYLAEPNGEIVQVGSGIGEKISTPVFPKTKKLYIKGIIPDDTTWVSISFIGE